MSLTGRTRDVGRAPVYTAPTGRQPVVPVGRDDARDGIAYAATVAHVDEFQFAPPLEPLAHPDQIVQQARRRTNPTEATMLISAFARLLFKKGVIDAGDYQLIADIGDRDYMDVISRIIQVAEGMPVEDAQRRAQEAYNPFYGVVEAPQATPPAAQTVTARYGWQAVDTVDEGAVGTP